MEENGSSNLKALPISNGSPYARKGSSASVDDNHFSYEEYDHVDSNGKECSTHHSEVDLLALENEASDLNNRMEVLKADYHFLVHIFNSMQNGNEGLEFVQEIAHQLGEI